MGKERPPPKESMIAGVEVITEDGYRMWLPYKDHGKDPNVDWGKHKSRGKYPPEEQDVISVD